MALAVGFLTNTVCWILALTLRPIKVEEDAAEEYELEDYDAAADYSDDDDEPDYDFSDYEEE